MSWQQLKAGKIDTFMQWELNTNMTNRLYYDTSYTTAFRAQIIEALPYDTRIAIVLDETYFYPTSGGQPHDTGTLDGLPIVDVVVRDADSAILHILSTPSQLTVGQTIQGVIDWERRFDHMQQHTGQHILTQAFAQTAGARTVGFHLSPDSVTIDLDQHSLSEAQIFAAENLANEVVQADKAVIATLRAEGEHDGVRMRKRPKHVVTDGLRVIEIEGFDQTACGGTHVSRTGEIGLIKVIKTEKRGDKTRVEFRCGGRALADYRDKHQVISALAADMNCRFVEIPELVGKLRTELKTIQQALKEAREQIVEFEAERLLNRASRTDRYALITAAFDKRDAAEVKRLASRLAENPDTVVLLGTAGEKAQLFFARSTALPFNMGALLKEAVEQLGGRGGGQAAFAQGGGVPASFDAVKHVLEATARRLDSV